MSDGIVKWFNEKKGYGFIGQKEGSDIFFHYSNIKTTGFKSLKEGQKVTFEMVQGKRGPVAINVKMV